MSRRQEAGGTLVSVSNLTKEYGDTRAIDDVSLRISGGEIFGLLGPNGAGKSTMIKILTTITEPTSGRAEVDGWGVTEHPHEVRRRIDYVPQRIALDYWLTGRQTLELFGSFRNIPPSELDQQIEIALEVVGLLDHAEDEVDTYSGGMKRRLEIASGLLHSPELVILDEPTLGLDPRVRAEIWEYIEKIKDEGTSVLIATHYLDEADRLCDRIAIIDNGQVVSIGTPTELKRAGGQDHSLQDVFHSAVNEEPAQGAHDGVAR